MKRNFKKWMLVGLCAMMSMQTSVAVLAEEMSLSEVQSNETVIVQGRRRNGRKMKQDGNTKGQTVLMLQINGIRSMEIGIILIRTDIWKLAGKN